MAKWQLTITEAKAALMAIGMSEGDADRTVTLARKLRAHTKIFLANEDNPDWVDPLDPDLHHQMEKEFRSLIFDHRCWIEYDRTKGGSHTWIVRHPANGDPELIYSWITWHERHLEGAVINGIRYTRRKYLRKVLNGNGAFCIA